LNNTTEIDVLLLPGKKEIYWIRLGVDYSMFFTSSISITYNDSITIIHGTYTDEGYAKVKRDLRIWDFYTITTTKSVKKPFKNPEKRTHRAEYTFTEDDYLEALEIYYLKSAR